MKSSFGRWSLIVAANVCLWCMLSFYETGAAQSGGQPPFRNAVEQRNEMIRELKEIKTLLKEQNDLLRSAGGKKPADDASKR